MAWAETPTTDGSYTETSTSPDGKTVSTSWSVNSCGDGCILIKAGAGGHQAQLVDGQWVSDTFNDALCPDGSYVVYASKAHMTWDPNTLVGTADRCDELDKRAECSRTSRIDVAQSSELAETPLQDGDVVGVA